MFRHVVLFVTLFCCYYRSVGVLFPLSCSAVMERASGGTTPLFSLKSTSLSAQCFLLKVRVSRFKSI